jgi:hypothetical protein
VAEVFRRPELAAELASRLLRPGVLDEGLRSGLVLSGLRRTGKTTFLRTDLVPELEAQGAVVIYVDLWSNTKVSPAAQVQAFTELVDQSGGDVVLIVDEVQQAISTEEGNQMLLALKAARDAINPRPGTPGHFLFLGTGSHEPW